MEIEGPLRGIRTDNVVVIRARDGQADSRVEASIYTNSGTLFSGTGMTYFTLCAIHTHCVCITQCKVQTLTPKAQSYQIDHTLFTLHPVDRVSIITLTGRVTLR